jgi:hypothetical protein
MGRPGRLRQTKVTQWSFGEEKAKLLESRHYHVYTTIKEDEVLDLLPQVMEGALSMYQEIAPGVAMSDRHMDCFIFRWRSEWDEYTQKYAGNDAKVYLQIRSGGYTIYDRYVAYYIGREGTFAVAAHEGWHQFAGRHFKGRMPPFLEEGLACMFETISWKDHLPRWNLSVNTQRAQTLRKAMDAKDLWPLEKLISMHAGDIVGESNDRIDAFYAQCWAFATETAPERFTIRPNPRPRHRPLEPQSRAADAGALSGNGTAGDRSGVQCVHEKGGLR